MRRSYRLLQAVAVALLLSIEITVAGEPVSLPPPIGPTEPRVQPISTDAGRYTQSWFNLSFHDLREDFAEARSEGKRFAVIFEQRGCPYCKKLHTEVLAQRYINDYVRENFHILQLDLWGAREVTDFDGKVLSERELAERWSIMFTPTVVFLKDDLSGFEGQWGRALEATERLPLSFGAPTFYDLFVWVRTKTYERDRNFQRFHLARFADREALKGSRPGNKAK
jgi:thioredoxin-related protein